MFYRSDYVIGGESVAEDIDQLTGKINNRLNHKVTYPPYLTNPDSIMHGIAVSWMQLASGVKGSNLIELYDEYYVQGIEYDGLRVETLLTARRFIKANDYANATRYLEIARSYEEASIASFNAANQVFMVNLDAAEKNARLIKNICQHVSSLGLGVLNPGLGRAVDYAYMIADYAVERSSGNLDKANKELVLKLLINTMINDYEFSNTLKPTIAGSTEHIVGKSVYPAVSKYVHNEKVQFYLLKTLKEMAVGAEEELLNNVILWIDDYCSDAGN